MSQAWNRPSTTQPRWRKPPPPALYHAVNDNLVPLEEHRVGLAQALAILALGCGVGVATWAIAVALIFAAFPVPAA